LEFSSLTIWIIGGTGDSAEIVRAITTVTSDYVVTVTTPEASLLYGSVCPVIVGMMDRKKMAQFCYAHSIRAIIDASHPFAVTVSQNAIANSQKLKIPYLRYERASVAPVNSPLALELDSFETLVRGNYLLNHRVLLTVGYNALPRFQSWHDRSILFARILPKLNSLQIALDSGFKSDRIIAMRPPITKALEIALWQQWKISLVVTKASGRSGGEDMKRQVAEQLGIPLITIARPKIIYPQQTSQIEKIREFCQTN
jgi:precorrin-6A/cobalt-precorrin-6A reductase